MEGASYSHRLGLHGEVQDLQISAESIALASTDLGSAVMTKVE